MRRELVGLQTIRDALARYQVIYPPLGKLTKRLGVGGVDRSQVRSLRHSKLTTALTLAHDRDREEHLAHAPRGRHLSDVLAAKGLAGPDTCCDTLLVGPPVAPPRGRRSRYPQSRE